MREKDRGWSVINENAPEQLWAKEVEAGRAEMHHQEARKTQDELWNAARQLGRVEHLCDQIDKETKARALAEGVLPLVAVPEDIEAPF